MREIECARVKEREREGRETVKEREKRGEGEEGWGCVCCSKSGKEEDDLIFLAEIKKTFQ